MFQWIHNTYLGKLFQLDRKLSFWVGGFFFLTVFFNLVRLEATPFFLWGMYSASEKPRSTYDVLKIRVGDTSKIDLYTGVSDNSRFFLSSPIQYYKELQENNNIDNGLTILQEKFSSTDYFRDESVVKYFYKSSQVSEFADWYAKYLASQTGKTVNSLTLTNLSVRFAGKGIKIVDSSHVLLKWPNR